MKINFGKRYTTYIGTLVKVLQISKGDVVEMGAGVYSTPLLHWICKDMDRHLTSFENDKEYFNFARQYQSRLHRIRLVSNWDEVNTTRHCGVVFIDHMPSIRRGIDAIRFKDSADYIILHDTEGGAYGYEMVWPYFKYKYTWKEAQGWVSVVSNFKDLSFLESGTGKIETPQEKATNPLIPLSIQYGSHLPALIKAINLTSGPVLELGTGIFSTPFLHFACYPERRLVSYESNKDFYNQVTQFKSNYHEIHFVEDWDKVDLSGHWSVVLVDHEPTSRRKDEIKRLAGSADYIVVHDTNPRLERKYRYSEIYPLFKFRKDFNREKPYTSILSNFKDLSQFESEAVPSPNTINNSYYSIDNLDNDSLVIDAGGYLGDFTANLGYDCNVIIFEPVPEFFKYCKERFKVNPRIKIECFGLGTRDGRSTLYVRKDASSFYEKWKWAGSSDAITVNTICLSKYIKGFPKVDLLKLNIEGTEYDVLGDLAENKQISKIKTILVQFHAISGFRTRYKMSQKILSETHRKTQGNFKWETWKRI